MMGPMPAPNLRIERPHEDADARYRKTCGERLSDVMDAHDVTRKELVRRLNDAGYETTLQSLSGWINGQVLPRPSMQVAIARALGVRPRSIYDIEAAA